MDKIEEVLRRLCTALLLISCATSAACSPGRLETRGRTELEIYGVRKWAMRVEHLREVAERVRRESYAETQIEGLRGKSKVRSSFTVSLKGGHGDPEHLLEELKRQPRKLEESILLLLWLERLISVDLQDEAFREHPFVIESYDRLEAMQAEGAEVMSMLGRHVLTLAREADERRARR